MAATDCIANCGEAKAASSKISMLSPEVDQLIFAQSHETDVAKRKQPVWAAERKIIEDVARPIILHNRAGTCWYPHLKGVVPSGNSTNNSWRFEDAWLDK